MDKWSIHICSSLDQSTSGQPPRFINLAFYRLDIPRFWGCSKAITGGMTDPEGKVLRSRVPLLGKWRGRGTIGSAAERVDVGFESLAYC